VTAAEGLLKDRSLLNRNWVSDGFLEASSCCGGRRQRTATGWLGVGAGLSLFPSSIPCSTSGRVDACRDAHRDRHSMACGVGDIRRGDLQHPSRRSRWNGALRSFSECRGRRCACGECDCPPAWKEHSQKSRCGRSECYGAIAVLSPRQEGEKGNSGIGSTPGSIGMIAACGVIASLAGVAEVFLVIPVFSLHTGNPAEESGHSRRPHRRHDRSGRGHRLCDLRMGE